MKLSLSINTQEFNNALETASDNLGKAVTDSLNQLADNIRNTTTSLCPVRTGALKASIIVEVTDESIDAEATEDYASFVDEGTSRMGAQPFFTQPITDMLNDFNSELDKAVTDALSSA
jgi:HK97 gp10 family phage protein